MYFSKSPFNYIGNKFRIMRQLTALFPKEINSYADLFCGGCDAAINVDAKVKYANDINFHLIDICKVFQSDTASVIPYIDATIAKWQLSKTNEAGYNAFRAYYNQTRNPLDLYVLVCYSFNYQFRFNSQHEYNNPFGRNRSSFNDTMRKNLIAFLSRIQNVQFSSLDFESFDFDKLGRDGFVYCDPPYLLTCGSYNDGKRGFNGWGMDDEMRLLLLLDRLSEKGIKFALSNVIEHKGTMHETLLRWVSQHGYTIHGIDFNYNNCNYHSNNRQNSTKEVLITNY